ncbi:hypothetical protein LWI29_007958 [Acer saccharum]|uniref:Uncharacterized protein n=1 Tax=Acer saccharum TaxID=4024 RepID=A0AA39S6F5_ACESA|nr:hypothetical protein LWI29_007958 [Acer saccharum]
MPTAPLSVIDKKGLSSTSKYLINYHIMSVDVNGKTLCNIVFDCILLEFGGGEGQKSEVKELEENIAAVAFTANSKMGKALMVKCKTLQEENDEIGCQNEEAS